MKKQTCLNCGAKIHGRSDKKFCGIDCKNAYNYTKRQETKSVTKIIDQLLHKNHHILSTLIGTQRKRMKIDRLELEKMGFSFKYITGYYVNSQNKKYHYVYDFAWMEFSNQEIMIIKK